MKKRISLEELENRYRPEDYMSFCKYINSLVKDGVLKPIKRCDTNGKKPPLPLQYWEIHEDIDYSNVFEEIKYIFNPLMDMSYYKKHPEKYSEDRVMLLKLNDYLERKKDLQFMRL